MKLTNDIPSKFSHYVKKNCIGFLSANDDFDEVWSVNSSLSPPVNSSPPFTAQA